VSATHAAGVPIAVASLERWTNLKGGHHLVGFEFLKAPAKGSRQIGGSGLLPLGDRLGNLG
jgi:hypothetical protein